MYPNSSSSNGVGLLLGGFGIFALIFSLAILVFAIIIYWRIVSKAGYNGALSLLLFVPVVNIVMLCIFAFGQWPIYRELNALRAQAAAGPQYQQYPQQSQYPQQQQQYPQYPQQQMPPQQYPQYPQNPQ